MGQTMDKQQGTHVGNWEVSAAPCTAQMNTSFRQLLSHQETLTKTFSDSLLLSDYYILNNESQTCPQNLYHIL